MRPRRVSICPVAIILLLAGLCLPAFFSAASRLPEESVRIFVAQGTPEAERGPETEGGRPETRPGAEKKKESVRIFVAQGTPEAEREPEAEGGRPETRPGVMDGDAPKTARGRLGKTPAARAGTDARTGKMAARPAAPSGPSATAPEAAGNARAVSAADAAGARQPGRSAKADAPFVTSSLRDILLEQAAAFIGVPAPVKSGDGMDEGAGFHQDGASRRAGTDFDGRRAAAFMASGLSYDPQNPDSAFRPGYNPFTGEYFRFFDYTPNRQNRRRLPFLDGGTPDATRSAFLSRGLSWASGFANSMAETLLTGLAEGTRARLNFLVDDEGEVSGEGDVLFPLYDGTHTTVFAQAGARTMAVNSGEASGQTRWIGNFGLGQRWYPFAGDEKDAGNLMLGYNIFLDNDFTRSHQRGGIGVELQADWLKLSSNYYWPLSDWKGSRDFDSRFIEERPARGWDLRAKAYLPFYRNVALTGSYTQWYGDHVGVFGPNRLEKDPRVWSYGVEFTPVPMLTAFVRQRSTERGRTDTEFGLNFVYHFGMDAKEQLSHAKVAELRTVSGSRHDFVDRENKIILEYRAKQDYRIEYLGRAGDNQFRFRVTKAFGGYAAGATVTVSTGGIWLAQHAHPPPDGFLARVAAAIEAFIDRFASARTAHAGVSSKQYVTDGRGEFLVRLDPAFLPPGGTVTVTARIGNAKADFTLHGTPVPATYSLEITPATLVQGTATPVTFTLKQGGSPTANKSLTFAANGHFTGLPTTAQTTLAGGKIPVSSLTALDYGPQTIEATVDG
ncbi:MAG: inverse autotransporter beta domain-containing protein, partial [Desulfovibrio sp.]|nr:inverse autotransporter beta domain-containing protein [Desulfovibrio sp.]